MTSKTLQPLEKAVELQRGFDLPSDKRNTGHVPVVASTGVAGYHDVAMVNAPGVVIGRSGSIGGGQYVTRPFWPLNTTLWVKDFRGNDPRFCYYLLRNIDFKRFNVGSGVPTLNRNHIASVVVNIPPLAEQKRIAGILGALDDKIELNSKMNETLERIAQALFQSWFVDFDPVHAKIAGRQPAGMDKATAELFPDSFVDSELGKIPKGWKIASFAEHMEATRGLSYKGDGLRSAGSGLPMHNLNSIYEGGGYKHEGLKFYEGEYKEKHLVKPGDMIVTNTEQGFDQLLIGHAALVPNRYGEMGIFSHHLYRVRPKNTSPLTPHYLIQLINNPRWHHWIGGFSNGTTINMLPLDALEMPTLALPPVELIKKYTLTAKMLDDQFEINLQEIETLTLLRNSLLPRLLRGE